MGLVTVRVYATDESDDALEGVLVQVYDDSDTFVTQNTTSLVATEAYAEFTLNGDDPAVDYTIRMSKTGVAFDGLLGDDSKTPQAISVYDPPASAPTGTNYFTVQGQTFSRPAATDPRLCRASGFFKDASGRARNDLDFIFVPLANPLIVDGDAVVGYQVQGSTDSDGYFQVDLYRTGSYRATMESLEDIVREITVPDASSVNLVHLLFPVVDTVEFSPTSATVAVDATVDVTVTITTTSGVVLDPTDADVLFSTNDSDVATAQITDDGLLRIMGRSAGSTTITATRADTTITTIPELQDVDFSVTVT